MAGQHGGKAPRGVAGWLRAPADVALVCDTRLDGPAVLVAVKGLDGHDVVRLVARNCTCEQGRVGA